MIRGGNRACFASFGLHKTSIQLQICEALLDAHGPESSALVVCPLGVRREFMKEASARGFKRKPVYVKTNAEYLELRAAGGRRGRRASQSPPPPGASQARRRRAAARQLAAVILGRDHHHHHGGGSVHNDDEDARENDRGGSSAR